jgi:ActR/RegA family two-component response regulator
MKSRRQTARLRQARELALAYLGAPDPRDVVLSHVEDSHIKRVLDACDGNLSLAAELLGMHRRSLQRYERRRQKRR